MTLVTLSAKETERRKETVVAKSSMNPNSCSDWINAHVGRDDYSCPFGRIWKHKEEANAEENNPSELEDLFSRNSPKGGAIALRKLVTCLRVQRPRVGLRSLLEELLRRRNIMGEREIDRSTDSASSVRSAFNEDIKCAQNMSQYLIHMLATSDRFELTEQVINCCKERYGTNWRAVLAHLSAFASAEDARSSLTSGQPAERENTDETLGDKFMFYGSAKKRSKSCKHCDFVANTKLEYWEHMRCHISGFNCSECSFVTKYKHHMNHHWLSVHDGSKPFKCKKCPYTCVSKSMLTSHLKKHSNVYPYRCANCPYKTKFCNALKKHLRKKLHQPAMVLNPDGTPNPFSVIDVYGTKRGPKQKSIPAKDDDELQLPVTHYLTADAKKADSTPRSSQSAASQNQPATCSDLVSAVNLSSQRLLREDESTRSTMDAEEDETSQALVENSAAACSDKTTDVGKLQVSDNTKITGGFSLFMTLGDAESHPADIPLDLRVGRLVETSRLSVASSSKISGTRKRKGRAMKLESYPVKETETSEQSDVEVTSEFADSQLNLCKKKIEEAEETVADLLDKFICYFCEITFGNVLMYSIHMDYHGFDDPYTCNMCGLHYTDKVSFFLHIGRLKHTE